jgi:hypothetical protein
MARTRGASNVVHVGEAELLGRDGVPLNPFVPGATVAIEAATVPPVVVPPPVDDKPRQYHCDASTCAREMDAWEMMQLLNLMFGGLTIDLSEERFNALRPDVKRHFRPVT